MPHGIAVQWVGAHTYGGVYINRDLLSSSNWYLNFSFYFAKKFVCYRPLVAWYLAFTFLASLAFYWFQSLHYNIRTSNKQTPVYRMVVTFKLTACVIVTHTTIHFLVSSRSSALCTLTSRYQFCSPKQLICCPLSLSCVINATTPNHSLTLSKWVTLSVSSGGAGGGGGGPGCDFGNSSPSHINIKNERSCSFTSFVWLHGVQRDSFAFVFVPFSRQFQIELPSYVPECGLKSN